MSRKVDTDRMRSDARGSGDGLRAHLRGIFEIHFLGLGDTEGRLSIPLGTSSIGTQKRYKVKMGSLEMAGSGLADMSPWKQDSHRQGQGQCSWESASEGLESTLIARC